MELSFISVSLTIGDCTVVPEPEFSFFPMVFFKPPYLFLFCGINDDVETINGIRPIRRLFERIKIKFEFSIIFYRKGTTNGVLKHLVRKSSCQSGDYHKMLVFYSSIEILSSLYGPFFTSTTSLSSRKW